MSSFERSVDLRVGERLHSEGWMIGTLSSDITPSEVVMRASELFWWIERNDLLRGEWENARKLSTKQLIERHQFRIGGLEVVLALHDISNQIRRDAQDLHNPRSNERLFARLATMRTACSDPTHVTLLPSWSSLGQSFDPVAYPPRSLHEFAERARNKGRQSVRAKIIGLISEIEEVEVAVSSASATSTAGPQPSMEAKEAKVTELLSMLDRCKVGDMSNEQLEGLVTRDINYVGAKKVFDHTTTVRLQLLEKWPVNSMLTTRLGLHRLPTEERERYELGSLFAYVMTVREALYLDDNDTDSLFGTDPEGWPPSLHERLHQIIGKDVRTSQEQQIELHELWTAANAYLDTRLAQFNTRATHRTSNFASLE